MTVMMLRWSWLIKIGLSLALGYADALVSHEVVSKIPTWFIMTYSTPIEFFMINGIIRSLQRIYKRFKNAR